MSARRSFEHEWCVTLKTVADLSEEKRRVGGGPETCFRRRPDPDFRASLWFKD